MSKNLEIEAKALINKKDYEKLVSLCNEKSYLQINHYIDDKDLSLSKKIGIRIREKNNRYELTVKFDKGEGKLEVNQDISQDEFTNYKNRNIFPNGEVKNELEEKGIETNKLFIFAKLITERTDIKYKNTLISIDKNTYGLKLDYEIECEANSLSEAKDVLEEFLNKNKILYKENHVSKLKRVIDNL